jgi:glutamate-1-semialdehyde 2,1-aminomutase
MSLDKQVSDYSAKTMRSRALHEEAMRVMPGGNSRTTTFFDPYPYYLVRGAGPRMWDADGVERLDFNGNYTSLILGHAPPDVVKAVQAAAEAGMSFPGPTEHEIKLAALLTERIPSLETVRFTNSGTEATMNAVRAARAFTGRTKLAKFEGAFHGTHDTVMVSVTPDPAAAGNRRRPKPVAWSSGIPRETVKQVVVLPWNDADACEGIIEREATHLAALIVDPLMGIGGILPPAPGFLERLRAVTERHGIVLIFDEVISFRIAYGGAQERFVIRPDLTTLGKIIGGGLPVGAYGGARDLMSRISPLGPVYQAGTLSGNPLAVAAGLATLRALEEPSVYERLERMGARMEADIAAAARATGVPVTVNRVGSMLTAFFTEGPVVDYASARRADTARYGRFFHGMLDRGVFLAASQFEAAFVSLAHTDKDLDDTARACREALAGLR